MATEPSAPRSPLAVFLRASLGGLIIIVGGMTCAPVAGMAVVAGFVLVTGRPGIGDVEKASAKLEHGMTRGEVRSLLGRPHQEREDGDSAEWDYYATKFVGSVLRVHFDADGKVTPLETWCD